MDNRQKAEENTNTRKDGYIRNSYLEESFAEVKQNLDKLVKALVENEDHQLNSDEAAINALLKKVETNKAKIMMALTYLNRYYDIKYGDMSIKKHHDHSNLIFMVRHQVLLTDSSTSVQVKELERIDSGCLP